jgi:hypothetical protein
MTTWKLGKRARHSAPVPDRLLGAAWLQAPPGRLTLLRSLAFSLCVAGGAGAQGVAGNSQAPAGATVQAAGGAGTPGSAADVSRSFEAMKSDLRRLVGANQVYRAESGQYTTSVAALHGYRASAGVTVTILQASSTGWAAQATAVDIPGKSCVISIGSVARPPTTMRDRHSGPEAVVVCDNP